MSKVKLKDVSTLITKGTTPSSVGCEFVFEGINFIKSESISSNKHLNNLIYEHIDEMTDEKLKRSRLAEGDLLFSIAGAYLGKIAIVRNVDLPANTNQAVGIVRLDKKKVDVDYLYYYFSQKHVNEYINKLSSQSSQPNLNLDLLGKLEFEFQNIQTQRQIAAVLSALDAKIELNNRINAQLEAMAKTLYDYWFVQFDFPYSPPLEGRLQDGVVKAKPYKSSGGKMVYNEELKREIPEGWEVGTLASLGEIIGGSTPPREVEAYFTKDGIAWITPKDLSLNSGNKFITKGELDVSEKGIKAASLNIMPEGTILLSSRAPIGYLAISRDKVTTNQGFKSIVPNSQYPKEYIYYTVKNLIPTIENNAVGSTFKEVSASTLKSIKIFLPNQSVVKQYTEKVKSIFQRQDVLEIENQQLAQLRDWLLPMLMNGQVTVNNNATVLNMAAEDAVGYGK